MRIFVTGGTGYIGSAVVRELAEAGHAVVALTRLAERSSYLDGLGARITVVGDVRDAGAWREAALESDALVHLAAEDSDARAEADRAALNTLLDAGTAGRPRSLVYTSGCFILGETGDEPVGEDGSTAGAPPLVAWRTAHERRVLAADGPELATAVIRPGMVYGGKEGAFSDFFATAETDGSARFVGDGANHWSPVYRGDVARLYRTVLERRGRGIFHGAEPAARVGDLAVAASRAAGAGGATERWRVEDARTSMGPFADALTMNQVLGWPRSRALGWEPVHPPFEESAEAVYREWKA
ncbi:MAG: NAD-dependent epimerase/dehydratase family protein [Gemmatimonadota bacterium]|jgi:nucleoside-diphosphate-sugar epimerase